MTRVAAVDCGTNSVRLLVADVDPASGKLVDLDRRMEITRLGQDVDRTGGFAPEALRRTLGVLESYAASVRDHGAGSVRVAATSASRDAANRDEFAGGVRDLLGVDPEVIAGGEEAALSYVGGTRELAGHALPTPYLLVDVGGGSTEYVLGDGTARASTSVDIGSVRLTERHFHNDPPLPEQVDAAVADIDETLDRVSGEVPLDETATIVGVAGSVTTVAGLALGLEEYDPARIHHSRIPVEEVYAVSGRLLALTHAERAESGVIHPGRVDVIPAGALIFARTLRRLGLADVMVSEHDLLDGLAWSLA